MLNELLKRIDTQVQKQGSMGAIDLAPIMVDMALHSYPAKFDDALMALSGQGNVSFETFERVADFPSEDVAYIITNKLAINPYVKGANYIVRASSFLIEDDEMKITYEHAGVTKRISILLNADNTFTIIADEVH